MRIIDDNSNFASDFLSNLNLFNAFPLTTLYSRIILDIIWKSTHLWKIIQKQTLSKQSDICKTKTGHTNVNILVQVSIKRISAIKALKQVLNCFSWLDPISSQFLSHYLPVNANNKAVPNHIYAILLLNLLKQLIVERVFDHIIHNKRRFCVI